MKWAPEKDFHTTRRYFAFSCVDLVVMTKAGVILSKRKDHPYKRFWHLPGGIIHKGQTIAQKISEIADREIGHDLIVIKPIGVYENCHPYRHDISYCFIAKLKSSKVDTLKPEVSVFRRIPSNTI